MGTSSRSGEGKGLGHNLNLVRKYGTKKDKECLKGSGMAGNKPMSKTFHKRLKKSGERRK